MGGAAGHDQDGAVARGRAAAVAVDVAAPHRVGVEDGRADGQRPAVAEPQAGAGARAQDEVGVARAQGGQLGVAEVGDPHRAGAVAAPRLGAGAGPRRADAGRDHVGHQPVHLGQVAGPAAVGERQVHGRALQDDAAAGADPAARLAQVGGYEAVAPHRGQPLQDHARASARAQAVLAERLEVLEAADGVDDARVVQHGRRGAAGHGRGRHLRSPGRHDEHGSVEAGEHLGQLVVGADADRVDAEPVGLAGQRPRPKP